MRVLKYVAGVAVVFALSAGASVPILAHEETYKGTVIAVKEKEQKLEVRVMNEKTKKDETMVFEVTAKTKVLRGDKEVKFAEAHIAKDERIAVTVNHDVPGQKATVIRLAAH